MLMLLLPHLILPPVPPRVQMITLQCLALVLSALLTLMNRLNVLMLYTYGGTRTAMVGYLRPGSGQGISSLRNLLYPLNRGGVLEDVLGLEDVLEDRF